MGIYCCATNKKEKKVQYVNALVWIVGESVKEEAPTMPPMANTLYLSYESDSTLCFLFDS